MASRATARPGRTEWLTCLLVTLGFALSLAHARVTPVYQGPDEPTKLQPIILLLQRAPEMLERREYFGLDDEDSALQARIIQSMREQDFDRWVVRDIPPGAREFDDIWNTLRFYVNSAPPGYFVSAAFFAAAAGVDELVEVTLLSRLWSVLLIAPVPALAFVAARAVVSRRAGVVAAGFAAFLPMGSFIAGTLNNDNLLHLAAAVFFAGVALLLARGWSWRVAAMVALAVVVGVLTKRAFLPLLAALPLVAMGLAWQAGPRWRPAALAVTLLSLGAAVGVGALTIAVLTNPGLVPDQVVRYFFNWEGQVAQLQQVPVGTPLFWRAMQNYAISLYTGFFGMFGWYLFPLPGWMYWTYAGVLAGAVTGCLAMLRGARVTGRGLWVALAFIVPAVLLVLVASMESASRFSPNNTPQGRYLLPLLVPASLLVAAGWNRWLGRRPLLLGAVVLLLGLLAIGGLVTSATAFSGSV